MYSSVSLLSKLLCYNNPVTTDFLYSYTHVTFWDIWGSGTKSWRKFKSSWMLCLIDRWKVTDIVDKHNNSIFRIKQFEKSHRLFDPEVVGNVVIQNNGNFISWYDITMHNTQLSCYWCFKLHSKTGICTGMGKFK